MRAVFMIVLLTVIACSTRREESSDDVGLAAVIGDWSATLQQQNNSGVSGTARAQSALAATAVTLTIAGAASGGHHPWHVHRGTCGSNGAIVGDANAYPALHVGTDGGASGAATLGVALNEQERYHVNVHRSATELNVIIACGELRN